MDGMNIFIDRHVLWVWYYMFYVVTIIRHSRLPAGNALWFCQNFLFFFFFFFLFFRRQGFRMITFDRQAGPLQNFNRSHIMVIGRSVLFSDPARPPGGGVGRPKHPKIPHPPPKNKFLFACVSEPQEHFWIFYFFLRFKTPWTFLSEFFFQLKIPPPPHLHAPAQSSEHSPQSSCNNK